MSFKPRVKSVGYLDAITKTKSGSVVTLDEAKIQVIELDDSFTDDETELNLLIDRATAHIESYIGADILYTVNVWHCQFGEYRDFLIEEGNLQSITSIAYTDTDGNAQTLTSDDYTLRKRHSDFMIILDDYLSFNEMTITFVTGFGTGADETAGTLPIDLKGAILIKVEDFFDMERSSITQGVNYKDNRTAYKLADPYVHTKYY